MIPMAIHVRNILACEYITQGQREARIAKLPGQRKVGSTLTEFVVLEIRRLYGQGMTQADLAERSGVSQKTISQILTRKTWRDV